MGYLMGISRSPPEEWADVVLARTLNRVLGTNLGPWDLAGIPDVYIELILEGVRLQGELAEAGLTGGK
jgi:hypothetical protein